MINQSYQDIVKIGKTTKDPDERAKELSSATGVATPFVVVYKRLFNNCNFAEKVIHQYLTDKGYRVNASREFFSISITDAINIIIALKDDFPLGSQIEPYSYSESYENLGEEYYCKGQECEFGSNTVFIDYRKAIDYYQRAAELGVKRAYYRIGIISYYQLKNMSQALESFHRAAEVGEFHSYNQLGLIYLLDKDYKNDFNANVAWNNYFNSIKKYSSLILNDDKERNIVLGDCFYFMLFFYCLERRELQKDWIEALKCIMPDLYDFAVEQYDELRKEIDKMGFRDYERRERNERKLEKYDNIIDYLYKIYRNRI